MPDVPIPVEAITPAGLTPTPETALSDSDVFQVAIEEGVFLLFKNTSDASVVTFTVPRSTDPYTQRKAQWPLAGLDPTITVPAVGSGSGADANELLIGAFPRSLFGATLEFTVDDAGGLSCSALKVTRPTGGSTGWSPSGYPEPEGSGSGE